MRRRRVFTLATLFLLAPTAARAHPGRALAPHDLWRAWTLEPLVVLGLALALTALVLSARARPRHPLRQGVLYAAGIGALVLALVSPLDLLANALFSAHMVQHLLLVVVAPPLIVLGDPLLTTVWAFPRSVRRSIARRWLKATRVRAIMHSLRRPFIAWSLHVATLWLWHMPRCYEAAVRSPAVHAVEHASFFITALLFWWVALDRRRSRINFGALVFYMFAAGLQGTLLGAILTLARRPLYAVHFGTTAAWGLNPLEDQQLAGLIMWIPGALAYLLPIVPIIIGAMRGAVTSPGSDVRPPRMVPDSA